MILKNAATTQDCGNGSALDCFRHLVLKNVIMERKKKTLFPLFIFWGGKTALTATLMVLGLAGTAAADDNTSSTSTTTTVSANSIDDLAGEDPSSSICTTNGLNETDESKIFYFYNVGTKKFLYPGGYWGTHASLNTSPHAIYFESTTTTNTYKLKNNVSGSGTGTYITNKGGIYMDQEGSNITFEQSNKYSATHKSYFVKIGTSGYLTAYPNNTSMYCNYESSKYDTSNDNYSNQEWILISKADYYELFNASPATMKAVVDASFLMSAPDFRVNDTGASKWTVGGDAASTVKDNIFFGDETMYKKYDAVSGTSWTSSYNQNHQQNYGKYFYCYTKGLRNFQFYQDVQVHKAGWYLLRCNGFSTSNSTENIATNGKPLAYLYAVVLDGSGNTTDNKSAAALNVMGEDEATTLAAKESGAGIGVAFFNGEYENQVQLCLDKAADGNDISSDNPVTIRVGFYVDDTPTNSDSKATSTVSESEMTAVDNFKLYYAGPRRNPELILDEESTDLKYLTLATDDYTNSVLHLNRKLNANMWNTLILPCNLTWGQMKRTFGDDVKLAKLTSLASSSIQFTTVELKDDDETMLEAFTPYIIYPPLTDNISPAYTAEKFYTSEGEDNSSWLGTDYKSSSDESKALTKTVAANHNVITMVSLDREKLKEKVDTEKSTWVSTTTTTGSGDPGDMVCKGTMAKTYDDNGIISGRDNLNGDYFMYKGKMLQVPSGTYTNKNNEEVEYSYGLKAFRCWFEFTQKKDNAKVSLFIDGIEDSTTGVDDIHTSQDQTSYKRGMDGVYNMNGQKLRTGTSTDNLPKGMYIINGKKIVVR